MAANKREDKLLNPQGLRHFRRQYSKAEFAWGLVVGVVLASIGGWVAYRGAHPPPGLFNDGMDLLRKSKTKRIRVFQRKTVRLARSASSHGKPAAKPPAQPRSEADRRLPARLAKAPWRKKPTTHFTTKNLYEKINGREGYFKSFGFRQLFFTTLLHDAANASIDIEMYDMGKASNALGAYAGELSAKAKPEVQPTDLSHVTRNALFLSRGRFYVRMIGSDESKAVKQKLHALRKFFRKQLKGAPLPWAYGLLIAHMSIKASAISYVPANAFSFGFAKDVYTAKQGENTYLFISAQHDHATAKALSQQYVKGWLSYGEKQRDAQGHLWAKDRYIHSYATARAVERWVIGLQGAADWKQAQKDLAKLANAVKHMPKALRKRAIPAAQKAKTPKARRRPTPRSRDREPAYRGGGESYDKPRKPAYRGGGESYDKPRKPAVRGEGESHDKPNKPRKSRKPAVRGGEDPYAKPRKPAYRGGEDPYAKPGKPAYRGGGETYDKPPVGRQATSRPTPKRRASPVKKQAPTTRRAKAPAYEGGADEK